MKNRPGRPVGPTPGRGRRPWDPIQLTREHYFILRYVAEHADMPRWRIAEYFGISLSQLSVLTCSEIGQAYLAALDRLHCETGMPHKYLLQADEDIQEELGILAIRPTGKV